MTAHNGRRKSRLAALGLALCLATMSIGATSASAQSAPGNIDQDALGSLTIHKYAENGSAPGAPDGSVLPDPAGDPLEATFTLYPVSTTEFDPAVSGDWDGWAAAGDALATTANCSAAAAGTDARFGTALPPVTTTGGVGTASNLPVGAYLVCETALPTGAVLAAAPFVATIPTPFEGDWVYDVHAFPKNVVNTVEKTVEAPDGLGLGSTVTFPVTTTIQVLPPGDTYTSFILKDTLDSRLSPVSVASVTVGGTTLTEGPGGYTVGGSGNTLLVTIDPAVINANVGEEVEVVFAGVVAELGNGSIQNTAILFTNNPDTSDDSNGTPSNPVTTQWGDLVISKVDADATSEGLEGAEFEVYASDAPYAASCASGAPTGAAINVGGDTVFTSDEDGNVSIAGLFVTDSDNDPNQAATQRCYFVREIKAPAGFVTPTGSAAYTAVAVTVGQTATFDVEIANVKQQVTELPLTGGAVRTLLIVGGGLLLAGSVVLMATRRRKDAVI